MKAEITIGSHVRMSAPGAERRPNLSGKLGTAVKRRVHTIDDRALNFFEASGARSFRGLEAFRAVTPIEHPEANQPPVRRGGRRMGAAAKYRLRRRAPSVGGAS